jgi:hypothetical protein
VICWLRPEDVRDGIWRTARFRGECSIDGDGRAGGGCGVGVPAGESLGDSSELMSMVMMCGKIACSCSPECDARLDFSIVCEHSRYLDYPGYRRKPHGLQGRSIPVANGMGRRANGTLLQRSVWVADRTRRRIYERNWYAPGDG